MSGPETDGTNPLTAENMTDVEKGLFAIETGHPLSITTPTGKDLRVEKIGDETVVFNATDGREHRGPEARERLKKALRAVGTEFSLQPATEHVRGENRD